MKYATFLTCSVVVLGSFAAHANPFIPLVEDPKIEVLESADFSQKPDRPGLLPSADDGDNATIGRLPPGYVEPAPLYPPSYNSGSGYYGSSSSPGIGAGNIREGVSIVRDLINLGKEAWQLVENSKPSITIDEPFDSHSASAVPEGIKHFSQMSYWKGPASKVYKIRWTALGLEYASFSYRITYQYGGKYQGAGQYLKNVTVIPEEIHMPWGYTFNSAVSVVDPINYGSPTDPLAGLQVVIRYSIGNAFGKQESRRTHMIRGDGAIVELK